MTAGDRASVGGWAVRTATAGTLLIAAAAFWLSFTALSDLARRSGVAPGQAWAWPLIVDGLIVVATVAAVALDGRRAAWYPWLLLAAATGVSVTANGLHAAVADALRVPGAAAVCVAALPPLVLLSSTHLTVVLVRSRRTAPSAVADPRDDGTGALLAGTASAPEPAARRRSAAELREQGWSNKRIARRLGVAPSTVGRWFAAAGAQPAPSSQDHQEGRIE